MSGDEMEKFEVTDYDLDNEFNIHRPFKRLTKEQQIFGKFTFINNIFCINWISFNLFQHLRHLGTR